MPPPGCACAAAGGAPPRMEAAGGLLARARARRPEAVRLRKRRSVLYGAPGGPAGQRGAGKRGGAGRAVAAVGGTLDSQPSPPQALPAGQRRCWRSRWRCGRSTASSSRPASSRTSTGSRWRWRTAWSSNILRGPPPRCRHRFLRAGAGGHDDVMRDRRVAAAAP